MLDSTKQDTQYLRWLRNNTFHYIMESKSLWTSIKITRIEKLFLLSFKCSLALMCFVV